MSATSTSATLSEVPVSGGSGAFGLAEHIEDANLQLELEEVRSGAQWALFEFSDFQCPYCGMYARETWPSVRREYVDTGKVEYVFRHFPLARTHQHATAAAEAAECARNEGKFWLMHERLFFHQQALDRAALQEHAAAVGLATPECDVCTSGEMNPRVREDHALGLRLGVKGTQTFFIGRIEGRRVQISQVIRGAAPMAAFQAVLQSLDASTFRE